MMRIPVRTLSSLCSALALTASACDDPAPVVLGRLQIRVRDAGAAPIDAGDREHDRDQHERDHAGDESREHAEPSEHP